MLQTHLANNQSSLIAQWQPESKLEALLVNKAKRVHRRYYIQYKHLDATTIAYKRMKGEQDSRLHGRISLHKKTRQIEVVGYFNWISPIMPFLFIIFLMVFPFPLIIIAPIFIYATVAGQKSRHKSLTKRCYDFFRETKEETPKQNRSTTGNKSTVTTFEDIDLILEENPKSTKKGKYVQAPSDLL